jgi:hypothetical protein
MSEISDEELKRLLKELEELDEVPQEVAARMDATIDQLAAAAKRKKSSFFTSSSWALAAGFTLVFGLGVVLNLDSSPIGQTPSISSSKSPQNNNDDVLTSTDSEPELTDNPVAKYSTSLDYSKKITLSELPFKPTTNYGSIEELPNDLQSCVASLGLEDSISFIDVARYEDKVATAVWSAVTEKSWQISIIDSNCEGIAEVFVNE